MPMEASENLDPLGIRHPPADPSRQNAPDTNPTHARRST
jgi:hypothetical protein